MDLKDRLVTALAQDLAAEYVRLEDDEGISGYVVSSAFGGMSALDRQERIEETLGKVGMDREQRRHVLMIAGLTPEEYESVGARVRVHQVKELGGGAVEVLLHGGKSDAEYVRRVLGRGKDVVTADPASVAGAVGVLMSVRARRSVADPFTKGEAIGLLKGDRYVQVVTGA